MDNVRAITYTATGQIKTIQYGNGVETEYKYGDDQRLLTLQTKSSGSQTIQDLRYEFDATGNLTELTDYLRADQSRRTMAYSYDSLDRLTRAENIAQAAGQYRGEEVYEYDSIGNRKGTDTFFVDIVF